MKARSGGGGFDVDAPLLLTSPNASDKQATYIESNSVGFAGGTLVFYVGGLQL